MSNLKADINDLIFITGLIVFMLGLIRLSTALALIVTGFILALVAVFAGRRDE